MLARNVSHDLIKLAHDRRDGDDCLDGALLFSFSSPLFVISLHRLFRRIRMVVRMIFLCDNEMMRYILVSVSLGVYECPSRQPANPPRRLDTPFLVEWVHGISVLSLSDGFSDADTNHS